MPFKEFSVIVSSESILNDVEEDTVPVFPVLLLELDVLPPILAADIAEASINADAKAADAMAAEAAAKAKKK